LGIHKGRPMETVELMDFGNARIREMMRKGDYS
jgi:hypothetical protein